MRYSPPQIAFCALLFAGWCGHANASTVAWAAAADNGLRTSAGILVSTDSLVRLGYFSIDDQEIRANALDIPFLDSKFIEFGSARIGEGGTGEGRFSTTTERTPAPADFGGKQVYVWAFASGSVAAATEHGIYYMTAAADADWRFPLDANLGFTRIELTDLTPTSMSLSDGARIVVGGFSNTDFVLMAIPEPTTVVLLAGGVACLLGRRRRSR